MAPSPILWPSGYMRFTGVDLCFVPEFEALRVDFVPLSPSPPGTFISEYPAFSLGLIVGVTALGLMVLGFVNCFILVQKKSKFCSSPFLGPRPLPDTFLGASNCELQSSTEHDTIIDSKDPKAVAFCSLGA